MPAIRPSAHFSQSSIEGSTSNTVQRSSSAGSISPTWYWAPCSPPLTAAITRVSAWRCQPLILRLSVNSKRPWRTSGVARSTSSKNNSTGWVQATTSQSGAFQVVALRPLISVSAVSGRPNRSPSVICEARRSTTGKVRWSAIWYTTCDFPTPWRPRIRIGSFESRIQGAVVRNVAKSTAMMVLQFGLCSLPYTINIAR